MLSIYIVDDEPMAVAYLKMLLKAAGHEDDIVGTETNSVRAWTQIRKIRPDVVFTDISMPLMNGLDLAEKIIGETDARVYLLTSYEDFEFAKRGVKIGVADYVLKNEMTKDLLASLLEKAEQEIQGEKDRRQVVFEHNIREFLLSSSEITEDRIYEDRSRRRYALLTFCNPPGLCLQSEARTENLRLDSRMVTSRTFLEGMNCAAFVQVSDRVYCAVIFISETVVDSRRRLFQMGDAILAEINAVSPGWKCIYSDICLHFFELQKAYRKSEARTDVLYKLNEQSVFDVNDIELPENADHKCEEKLEKIRTLLSAGDHKGTVEETRSFFELCRKHDLQSGYQVHMRGLFQLLRRTALSTGKGLKYMEMAGNYVKASDLERALLNCEEMYFQELENAQGIRLSEHVLRAVQFIRENYVKDISVSDIAERVNISEGHLRRLFKQELDMSVIDYLTDYRLQRAKLLLKDPDVSFAQVWAETGFSSAQYFGYVFKKKEGVSPREYARSSVSDMNYPEGKDDR